MKISINEKFSNIIVELKSIKKSSVNDILYSALEDYYLKIKQEKVHDDHTRLTTGAKL